jgi:antitoxin (DNA-binding transcriptional repressor) of toxin-antitoxin stability system
MEYVHVRKTDLARNTSQVIRNVLRGQPTLIENHGQPEVTIVGVIDYLILRALAHFHAGTLPRLIRRGLQTLNFLGLSCKNAITGQWSIICRNSAALGE